VRENKEVTERQTRRREVNREDLDEGGGMVANLT